MARRRVFTGAILAMALVLGVALPAHAQGKKSDSEVKITAATTKPDAAGKQLITVTLAHSEGWHTYANPVGNDDFDSNKTVVTVLANGKPIDAKIEYPTGKLTKDKTVGDYKVYEHKVNIKAAIQRSPGDSRPLEVSVRIIACSERGVCLLPATVKVAVPR